MSISEYNYEAYFLDYHEGRLDAAATTELMDFLARHPELKEEFESFESISLNELAEEIKFENKESLKRSVTKINAANFDDTAVQYVEGTLNPLLSAELMAFVKQNPKYENELALYKKTKLVIDSSIVFENKESLKKRSRQRPVAWYYLSAAASVAIIVAVYFFFNRNSNQPATIVVSNTSKVDTSHSIQPIYSSNNKKTQKDIALNKNVAVSVEKHLTKESPANRHHISGTNSIIKVAENNNDQSVVQVQNNIVHVNEDSTAIISNKIVSSSVKDTTINHSLNQQLIPQFVSNSNNDTKRKSVFAFATNTFNGIKRFLKHGVEVNRYYSKESDKVIAYQITFGDNHLTLPLRNNSY